MSQSTTSAGVESRTFVRHRAWSSSCEILPSLFESRRARCSRGGRARQIVSRIRTKWNGKSKIKKAKNHLFVSRRARCAASDALRPSALARWSGSFRDKSPAMLLGVSPDSRPRV